VAEVLVTEASAGQVGLNLIDHAYKES